VTPCILVGGFQHFVRKCCCHIRGYLDPEDRSSFFFRNVSTHIPDCIGLHEPGGHNVNSLCFEDLRTYMRFYFYSALGNTVLQDMCSLDDHSEGPCLLSV
jgi:hypothetical protein